ncbi:MULTISPECIES: protein adenylyltransferase SelO [unclassified Agarivorans]|uniref:protein adenylyltransferase SelO n=1 Tax=unclassified Agarivorans TaxID=2636026 RepID=UPI0026E3929D|nr:MULTISPECIES: YdiU family protein [unclassified Agarivorans]MDO6685646.1 YdiU family protein [Agarivorans sp. 3_MG-2023]MDO6716239.1 YdiU family protein [Agarivorans sp. 2_MG-2023]
MEFVNRFSTALPELCHQQQPTPLQDPELAIVSYDAAALLGFDKTFMAGPEVLGLTAGKLLIEGMQPVSTVYAGHQFGGYSPQLGDGRALLLGELKTAQGDYWELQLKGSGLTPFSRQGDGKAVLRSTIREFLASEAMAALGIATTRALSLSVGSGLVQRERFEKEAMLVRMAPSHIRFGHFEYLYYQQQTQPLKRLIDFCLEHYFSDCLTHQNPVLAMLQQVVDSTALMIAKWQAEGFCHGVMNTDNMSILGLTIDYGPYGFLDDYNPGHICNHSDHYGRYAFNQQPGVGLWNLQRLAQALSDYVPSNQAEPLWMRYQQTINQHYQSLMLSKLGLTQWQDEDEALLGQWLSLLAEQKADYHQSMRALAAPLAQLPETFSASWHTWLGRYSERCQQNELSQQQRIAAIKQHVPEYVLRNYLAQQVIEKAEQGDYTELHALHQALSQPFTQQQGAQCFAAPPPDWGKCLEISCSS